MAQLGVTRCGTALYGMAKHGLTNLTPTIEDGAAELRGRPLLVDLFTKVTTTSQHNYVQYKLISYCKVVS